jgi:hypothetical protein
MIRKLNRDKGAISKAYIFDMDGTMLDTPLPEMGKMMYSMVKNRPYPHNGWWSRPESLLPEYDIQPVDEVHEEYKKANGDNMGLTIMLTNRMVHLRGTIQKLLESHNLLFDIASFKEKDSRTKLARAIDLMKDYPNISEVEIWEDMKDHIIDYSKIWDMLPGVKATIHYVGDDRTGHKKENWVDISNPEEFKTWRAKV